MCPCLEGKNTHWFTPPDWLIPGDRRHALLLAFYVEAWVTAPLPLSSCSSKTAFVSVPRPLELTSHNPGQHLRSVNSAKQCKLCFSFNNLLLHLEPSVKLWQLNAPPRDSVTFESKQSWDAILNSLSPPASWRKPPRLPRFSCLMKDSFCLRNNVSYCLE